MLENLIEQLSKEAKSTYIQKEKNLHYLFHFTEDIPVEIKKIGENLFFQTKIFPCPEKERGEIFAYLMRANLLGNGTGTCALGLDDQEKFLTLVSTLLYEDNYEMFKEFMEDFLNYSIYWKEEIQGYLQKRNQ